MNVNNLIFIFVLLTVLLALRTVYMSSSQKRHSIITSVYQFYTILIHLPSQCLLELKYVLIYICKYVLFFSCGI